MLLKSSKFLISAYHVINENIKNKSIEIEIYNKKKINLELESRFIKYYIQQKDISIVEIKDSDGIQDIEYIWIMILIIKKDIHNIKKYIYYH